MGTLTPEMRAAPLHHSISYGRFPTEDFLGVAKMQLQRFMLHSLPLIEAVMLSTVGGPFSIHFCVEALEGLRTFLKISLMSLQEFWHREKNKDHKKERNGAGRNIIIIIYK